MRTSLAVVASFAFAVIAFARASDPWTDLGNALPAPSGTPKLTGVGDLLVYSTAGLTLEAAPPNQPVWLFTGLQQINAPFLGGTFVPSPDLVIGPIFTSGAGGFSLSTTFPANASLGVPLYFQSWIAAPANPQGAAASNALKGVPPLGPVGGTMPAQWINGGPNCGSEPPIQVHAYNPNLYILRQSLCTNFEAPFMFLIFGTQKVLMLDTGAGGIQIYNQVKAIIDAWLLAHGQASIQLIVAHLHSHGDHTAGDSQFNGKPNVTLVGTSLSAVQNFYGYTAGQWPTTIKPYDLGGGRIVDVIPIPGHQPQHIAIYDRQTALLFTGDSLYPGRCYVNGASSQGNWAVFKASIQRLVDFTSTRELVHVLGTHIEMTTTPMVDYPLGVTSHPNEHVLELGREHLIEMNEALKLLPTPVLQKHADFIIYPVN